MEIPEFIKMDRRFYDLLIKERMDNFLSPKEYQELDFLTEICDSFCDQITQNGKIINPNWEYVYH